MYKLNHSGEKGREAEEILKKFLINYLPKKYEVSTGFVHTDMGTSNQCDILIYDANNYSPLYSGFVNQIIPMLSLRAVVECTMHLNSNKIKQDNKKMANLKKLYRKDVQISSAMPKEPLAILFAYYSQGDTLSNLNRLEEKNFNIVFSADGKLYILDEEKNEYTNNLIDNIFSGETEHGYVFSKQQHAFAIFYSHMVDALNQINSDSESYSMVHQYSKSSVYVDYKK